MQRFFEAFFQHRRRLGLLAAPRVFGLCPKILYHRPMPSAHDCGASQGARVHFAEDEARFPWLTSLLDAYAVLDAGIARALADSGRKAACRTGCFACCLQRIPASTLEVLGIKWFVLDRLEAGKKRALARALRLPPEEKKCPFLLDGACAVYPARPMACREFIVLGRSCLRGELPDQTRPGDVLPLPVYAQQEAFSLLLPFYPRVAGEAAAMSRPGSVVLRDTGVLQDVDWSGLADALVGKIHIDRRGLGE